MLSQGVKFFLFIAEPEACCMNLCTGGVTQDGLQGLGPQACAAPAHAQSCLAPPPAPMAWHCPLSCSTIPPVEQSIRVRPSPHHQLVPSGPRSRAVTSPSTATAGCHQQGYWVLTHSHLGLAPPAHLLHLPTAVLFS